MFIIPVGNRVNWKRPPVVTLLLILINCFVFFFFQMSDGKNDEIAARYYFSSSLPKWELDRYAKYLESNGDPAESQQFSEMLRQRDGDVLLMMEDDVKFMRELRAGNIITPQDAEFAEWSEQRKEYEAKRSFTSRFVYQVDEHNMFKAFISAFMHGGMGHLFSNMVVLLIIGFMVESVIGKVLFTVMYVVSIFTSVLLFSLTAPGSSALGASGAISGVMGIYTVIYGLRKIDFFYSLAFYFGYVRAPAIVLLPLWLGNELYQFLTEQGAHIAYMAHFGGLLGGALMGVLYRWQQPELIESRHHEVEAKEMDDKTFQLGMDHLGALDFQKALDVFKTLQEKFPDDVNLTRLVYRAAKANPAGEDYHRAALRLMTLPDMDIAASDLAHTIFQEYLNCAKPAPRLGHDLIAKLARRFAGSGHCESAEKLASLLQRVAPQHGEIPAVLLALARGHYREQRRDKFESILQALISQFPQSGEAVAAADMLRMG